MNTVNRMSKKFQKIRFASIIVILSLFLSLELAYAQGIDTDPLETTNRNIDKLNQVLDAYLVKPVAKSYQAVVPNFAKRGISNFFSNLDDINVVVNDVLQLKLPHAVYDTTRFTLNSTLGIGGLFDVASEFGIYKHKEDFGQTLGFWGVESGAYVVLPFFGSSSVRDTVGMVPDMLFNPIHWVTDRNARLALNAVDAIETRTTYFVAEELISGDKYNFVRNAYLQRRAYLVADGEVYDEFDDY